MREIKFRAWIEETDDMVAVDIIDFEEKYIVHEDLSTTPFTALEPSEPECVTKFEDCVLMQYTGMKDKNGKEIYEGDIIQTVVIDAFQHQSLLLFKVEYKRGQFILCNSKKEIPLWCYTDEPIIGNIYENPELVERLEE